MSAAHALKAVRDAIVRIGMHGAALTPSAQAAPPAAMLGPLLTALSSIGIRVRA